MRRNACMAIGLMALLAGTKNLGGQQVPDRGFRPDVSNPAYASGSGPMVVVDSGHQNFHTLPERYAPFGNILRADGYRLEEISGRFSAQTLASADVLVIANAGTGGNAPWGLPTPAAFDEDEVSAVHEWVQRGGSLLIIADHMPAAGATASLAEAFGIRFTNGYTIQPRDPGLPGDLFTSADRLLKDHPITRGRTPSERADSVVTFTGQGFQATVPVDTILQFGPDAFTYLPVTAGVGFDDQTPRVPSPGWLHGVVLEVGAGRVAVFGEAAMFSAQLAGPNNFEMGLNNPRARGNVQLLLNTLRWLTGVIS